MKNWILGAVILVFAMVCIFLGYTDFGPPEYEEVLMLTGGLLAIAGAILYKESGD